MECHAPGCAVPPPCAPPPAEEHDQRPIVWASADYLLWWIKKGPEPIPLVTTGSSASLGVLGSSDTSTLQGISGINYRDFSGGRFEVGLWFDHDHTLGVEAGGFVLERRPETFFASSGANGVPVLARPVVNANTGKETVELVSAPGVAAGVVSVGSGSDLSGWDINALKNVYCSDKLQVDLWLGFRMVSLDEDLDVLQGTNLLAGGTANLGGATLVQPGSVLLIDHFGAQNDFYGGQLGARAEYQNGHVFARVAAKVALGTTVEELRVIGLTKQTAANGTETTVPGGLLALSTNIGKTTRDEFAVVPELSINVGYDFHRLVRVFVGYTFLYWSEVIRPGDQIDRTVNPALVPTSQFFGTAGGPARPARVFQSSEFWAQGINLGLELRY
jgi:hypothetical protein